MMPIFYTIPATSMSYPSRLFVKCPLTNSAPSIGGVVFCRPSDAAGGIHRDSYSQCTEIVMLQIYERKFCSPKHGAEYLNVCLGKFFGLLADGSIESFLRGNRRQVVVESLLEFAEKERAAAATGVSKPMHPGMRRKGESKEKTGEGGKDQA